MGDGEFNRLDLVGARARAASDLRTRGCRAQVAELPSRNNAKCDLNDWIKVSQEVAGAVLRDACSLPAGGVGVGDLAAEAGLPPKSSEAVNDARGAVSEPEPDEINYAEMDWEAREAVEEEMSEDHEVLARANAKSTAAQLQEAAHEELDRRHKAFRGAKTNFAQVTRTPTFRQNVSVLGVDLDPMEDAGIRRVDGQ